MLSNFGVVFRPGYFPNAGFLVNATRFCSTGDGKNGKGDGKDKPTALTPSAKLQALLLSMKKADGLIPTEKQKFEITRPKGRETLKKIVEAAKVKTHDEKIKDAVKEVAQVVVGDPKTTESELLKMLQETVKESPDAKPTDLGSIMASMKIEKNPELQELGLSKAARMRKDARLPGMGPGYMAARDRKKIDLFGHRPLGIFSPETKPSKSLCPTWDALCERDLKLMGTHPPKNAFEEMIVWTEQGKLWQFPIDNEQGFKQEDGVSFEEHVFLDEHLDPWCPKNGPIRTFMELVCSGLSLNPWMTVEYKKKTILWYRDYFEAKKPLLKRLDVPL